MKPGGGKRKGSQFERKIAKELSLWLSDNKYDDWLWLTSQSGGRRTQRKKTGQSTSNSAGDIGYLDEKGKNFSDFFLIEAKSGYTDQIDVLRIIDKKTKNKMIVLEWLEKAERERKESNKKEILLIFKRDRHDPCVIIEDKFFVVIEDFEGEYKKSWLLINGRYVVFNYADFFSWFTIETFGLLMENYAN